MVYVRLDSSDSEDGNEEASSITITEVESKPLDVGPSGEDGTRAVVTQRSNAGRVPPLKPNAQMLSALRAEARARAGVGAAARSLSSVSSVVVNSSDVHIGDTYLTQNVQSREVTKSKFLCLEFETELNMRRFRCSLAICLCWTIIAIIAITSYLFLVIIPEHRTRMDLSKSLPVEWYLARRDWNARNTTNQQYLSLPVQYVIIGHSGSAYCNDNLVCVQKVWGMQLTDLRSGFEDLLANFYVGGKGWIIEGRGGNVRSEMLYSWGDRSITIMFIGNYVYVKPDQSQLDHLTILLNVLIDKGVLTKDYKLFGSCQLVPSTISPGPYILRSLPKLEHWKSDNVEHCLYHL